MGELQFRLRSDGSSQPINLSATSSDLSLFSLSDPLEFGVQLQNLTLEGRARLDSATPAWNVEIRGVTPYLSYTGYDYEWPGKPILLAVTQAADRTVSMRLIPPAAAICVLRDALDKPCKSLRANSAWKSGCIPSSRNGGTTRTPPPSPPFPDMAE